MPAETLRTDQETTDRVNELRGKDRAFIVGDQWHLLTLADRLDACAPYLKEGETPAECIERNRKDTDAVLSLLAQEKRKNEAFEAGRVNAPSGTTSERVAIASKDSTRESPALLTAETVNPLATDEWIPFSAAVDLLRSLILANGSDFVTKNWDCKYIDARIDMRTGAMLLRPGNTSTRTRES